VASIRRSLTPRQVIPRTPASRRLSRVPDLRYGTGAMQSGESFRGLFTRVLTGYAVIISAG